MNPDRVRLSVEVVGIVALTLSQIFVVDTPYRNKKPTSNPAVAT